MKEMYKNRNFGFGVCRHPYCGKKFKKNSGAQKYCNKHTYKHSERAVHKHEEEIRKRIKRESLKEFIDL